MPNTSNLKRLSIKPSRELTQKLLSLNRTEVRRIVGILTGVFDTTFTELE